MPESKSTSPSELESLRALARALGVQQSYTDASGKRRTASPEALVATLRTLGQPVERPANAPDLLRAVEEEQRLKRIEPNIVVWGRSRPRFELRLPVRRDHVTLACRVELDDGAGETWPKVTIVKRRAMEPGLTRLTIRLEEQLPIGIHQMTIDAGGERIESRLFCAPRTCYGDSNRGAPPELGVFIPLYAVASDQSDGIGDFADLRRILDWAGDLGVKHVGCLPLLSCFIDHILDPSPYSPASRLFWNEIFLDLRSAPELELSCEAKRILASDEWRRESERLKREPVVAYRPAMEMKRRALEQLSQAAFDNGARRAEIERSLESDEHLDLYARYRAAVHRTSATWQRWGERQRQGDLREGADYDLSEWRLHVYAQTMLRRRLDDLNRRMEADDCRLYLDLPIGVNGGGYDVWRYPDHFADASVGAPPDPFFTGGQNWGFPPLVPQALRDSGHAYFRAVIRNHLEHAGMLRIDHVMALHRLFWIPEGIDAADGVYVRYPADEMYAILCIESHRSQSRIVGENLGTVPRFVNTAMKRRGLRRMSVAQFEFRSDPATAIPKPPADALASLNTHDTPTFPAFWTKRDIDLRLELGHLDKSEAPAEHRGRDNIKQAITKALIQRGELQAQESEEPELVARALLREIGRSEAEALLVSLEDLWGETEPQNVPGTTEEYPNWRRKSRRSLEGILGDRSLSTFLRSLVRLRRGEDDDGDDTLASAPAAQPMVDV